jgi:hypothetical protein
MYQSVPREVEAMAIHRGYVSGDTVPLPQGVHLPDGTEVEIRVEATDGQSAERRIDELGLTHEEAHDIRRQLVSFEEDWDTPGMEAYDDADAL